MSREDQAEVVLVGGGIMCATLATMLRELQPDMTIQVFERLQDAALESTEAMNNAGTGHAAYCELNYTPEKADGSVDIAKALNINGAFEVSLQLWSHLVEKGVLAPDSFLSPVPHESCVWGEANVRFLRARHAQLSAHPMFADMQFTESREQLAEWMPLMMKDREGATPLAATRVERGTDLDFGVLAKTMFANLERQGGFHLHVQHQVQDLTRDAEGGWRVLVRDLAQGGEREVRARFVFIGAGGGALPLLLKSGIPEGIGYGGFPVSGQWLVCKNQELVAQHMSKVYGKPSLGAPPMSVPHLDTRMIGGTRALLFGPYAGFTTKYLKEGSYLDMPGAIDLGNLWPMMAAGWHNLDLTRYLIGQVMQTPEDRIEALRAFMPTARIQDWDLEIAGQRVQIIKKDPDKGGKLEFGTEVVAAADGSLAALLGASPGASTAAQTMVALIERCFGERAQSEAWQAGLRRMVPSHRQDLTKDAELLRTVRVRTSAVLGLNG
jgi:malate dehydrogenase (quinone)